MPYKHIVLSGGGSNGISHLGALLSLKDHQQLNGLQNVFGVSAGAYIGLGLALNFNTQDFLKFADIDFQKFLHAPLGLRSQLSIFSRRFGLYSGKFIRKQVNEAITSKLNKTNATFAELFATTGIGFYVVATNISKKSLVIFSHEDTPDTAVDIAIQASMALPLLYEHVRLKMVTPTKYVLDAKGDIFVDGGLRDNFPLHICDYYLKQKNATYNLNETLGIYIIENEQQLYFLKQKGDANSSKDDSFLNYIKILLELFMNQKHEVLRYSEDAKRIIFINMENRSSINFLIDKKEIASRLALGRKAAAELLGYTDDSPSLPLPAPSIRSKL